MTTRKKVRTWIRRIWVTFGLGATAVFVVWSLVAYRASSEAREALNGDDRVTVSMGPTYWTFAPVAPARPDPVGLLFFPGALVDPAAYAPLARAVAAAGHPVIIVPLPRRGAFGGAEDPQLFTTARGILQSHPAADHWVLGGHSRGAVVASSLAADGRLGTAGVVLIGTTHPRDVDLAALDVPVTKVLGTRDGLAPPAKVRANEALLPSHTSWRWIEGANHSQFGWYGFQPGDRRARVSADAQHTLMIDAVLETLAAAEQ